MKKSCTEATGQMPWPARPASRCDYMACPAKVSHRRRNLLRKTKRCPTGHMPCQHCTAMSETAGRSHAAATWHAVPRKQEKQDMHVPPVRLYWHEYVWRLLRRWQRQCRSVCLASTAWQVNATRIIDPLASQAQEANSRGGPGSLDASRGGIVNDFKPLEARNACIPAEATTFQGSASTDTDVATKPLPSQSLTAVRNSA